MTQHITAKVLGLHTGLVASTHPQVTLHSKNTMASTCNILHQSAPQHSSTSAEIIDLNELKSYQGHHHHQSAPFEAPVTEYPELPRVGHLERELSLVSNHLSQNYRLALCCLVLGT